MKFQFIGKHPCLPWASLFPAPTDPGQQRRAGRIVIAGQQRRTLLHIVGLREPAPHGFGRNLIAQLTREGERPAGATPAAAPPAEGRRNTAQQKGELPAETVGQHTPPPASRQMRGNRPGQGAAAPSGQAALEAGARTEQAGGDLGGRVAGMQQKQNRQGQQMPLAGAPPWRQNERLLTGGAGDHQRSRHSRNNSEFGNVALADITGQPRCANLLWSL
jgi:hypothetical protein